MLNCKSTDWCKSLLIVGSPGNNWREVRWQQTKFLLASVALKVKLFQIFAIMPNCPFMMSAISNRQFCDRFPGHVLLFGADCQILILFLRKGKLHSKQKTKQKYQSLKGFFTRGYFFCLKSEDSIGEHWAVPKAHTGVKLRVGAQTASISKKIWISRTCMFWCALCSPQEGQVAGTEFTNFLFKSTSSRWQLLFKMITWWPREHF